MRTTAIALFGTRISPRFDCAQNFMLITISDDKVVTDQHTEVIRDQMSIMKVRRLAEMHVNTLICGGVDENSRRHLQACGISLLDNMKGKVADALSRYFSSPSLHDLPVVDSS